MFRTLAFSGHSTSASGHPAFSITRMHTASRGISSSLRSGVSIHPDLRRDSSVLTDILRVAHIRGLSSGGRAILDFYLDIYSFFESAGSSVCSSREGAT
jgi:hypothetical protein